MRTSRNALAAVFFICAGIPEAIAESARERNDFAVVDRIGTPWAYNAFLQQYPTGYFANLASEQIARLAGERPPPKSPAAVTSPNYGDAYFMRRHLKLQRN